MTRGSDDVPKRARRPSRKSEAEGEDHIRLAGSVVSRLTEIRASNSSLVATFGRRADGSSTMVPLIDIQLFGTTFGAQDVPDDASGPELFSGLVSLDNLAFLLQDMAFDLQKAIALIADAWRPGAAALSETRVEYTRRMLSLAARNLSDASESLAQLLPDQSDKVG